MRIRRKLSKSTADDAAAIDELELREGLGGKGESLWSIYRRRFRKHTLGKIGGIILLVLYGCALFAEFLSPFSMTYVDKTKSYHPPARIEWLYRDGEKTVFKPFVYEKILTDVARKTYKVVPSYTIRAISIEQIIGKAELRTVTYEKEPRQRKEVIIDSVLNHYDMKRNDPNILRLEQALDELEKNPAQDAEVEFTLRESMVEGEHQAQKLYLVKGNKNFLKLFGKGIPYRFLGLWKSRRHLVTSPTGGFFPWGADQYGRDMVSRLLYGARISLSVGILGAFITFIFGLAIGGISGYFGGIVDILLMRFSEILIAFPSLYLLFTLRAAFPSNLTSAQVYLLIVIILSTIGWASLARIIRGLVLSLKNEDFVLSAKTMGLSHWKIIRKHILPNTLSFVIIQATLTIPGYILGESALSLLGLGITEPQSSWGLMLSVARNHRVVKDFTWVLIPGFAIFLAIMAWNFFGDGIRDAVDPRSRHN